jgi:hypothetical protein
VFLAVKILIPVATAYGCGALQLEGIPLALAYLGGLGATLLVSRLLAYAMELVVTQKLRDLVLHKLEREGLKPREWNAHFVTFSPGPTPRLFEGTFSWDVGFLVLGGDRLVFLGDRVLFALRREHLVAIQLGPSLPRWRPIPRVYVTWKDPGRGTEGVFRIDLADGGARRFRKATLAAWCRTLQEWQQQAPDVAPLSEFLAALGTPAFGEVPGVSPRILASGSLLLKEALVGILIAGAAGYLLGLPFSWREGAAGWYALLIWLIVLFWQRLPYRLRTDPP